MQEREGLNFSGRLKNLAAVGILFPAASFISFDHSNNTMHSAFNRVESTGHSLVLDSIPSVEASQDAGFFSQFDKYLETEYGKAVAGALLVMAVSNFERTRRISREIDIGNMEKLAVFSGGVLIALSASLLAESFTDLDPKIAASLTEAFVVSQSVYSFLSIAQRHRALGVRVPSLIVCLALVAGSSALLSETFK